MKEDATRNPGGNGIRILIVDDEKSLRVTAGRFLSAAGYDVESADDAEAALSALSQRPFSLVFLDVILPGANGLSLLREALRIAPDIKIILMTGKPSREMETEARGLGATDYLVKPISKDVLLKAAAEALGINTPEEMQGAPEGKAEHGGAGNENTSGGRSNGQCVNR